MILSLPPTASIYDRRLRHLNVRPLLQLGHPRLIHLQHLRHAPMEAFAQLLCSSNLRPSLIPLLGERTRVRGLPVVRPTPATTQRSTHPTGAAVFTLSKGRGRFGRLRPKSVRGLPGNQARVMQRSPRGESWDGGVFRATTSGLRSGLRCVSARASRSSYSGISASSSRFAIVHAPPTLRREVPGQFAERMASAHSINPSLRSSSRCSLQRS